MIHELKILPQYFKEVVNGNKNFEVRKNDRGFKKATCWCCRNLMEKNTQVLRYAKKLLIYLIIAIICKMGMLF